MAMLYSMEPLTLLVLIDHVITSYSIHYTKLYDSVSMIATVVADLIEGGYPPTTPIAVVEKASWPDQQIVRGTLADIRNNFV